MVVGRIILVGEARTDVEDPDQLAICDQRDRERYARRPHLLKGRRIEVQAREVNGARSGLQVGDEGIVGGDLERLLASEQLLRLGLCGERCGDGPLRRRGERMLEV